MQSYSLQPYLVAWVHSDGLSLLITRDVKILPCLDGWPPSTTYLSREQAIRDTSNSLLLDYMLGFRVHSKTPLMSRRVTIEYLSFETHVYKRKLFEEDYRER